MAENNRPQPAARPKTKNRDLDALLLFDARHSHSIATSAGDFRISVAREVAGILSERPGNQLKAAGAGLQRLHENKLISAQEFKYLNQICKFVFIAQNGKGDSNGASSKIRSIYDAMLVDMTASPVALAIADIAVSGPVGTIPTGVGVQTKAASSRRSDKVDMGILGGAIGGSVLGGAIGGIGGAIVGAVVGAIGAGIATACST